MKNELTKKDLSKLIIYCGVAIDSILDVPEEYFGLSTEKEKKAHLKNVSDCEIMRRKLISIEGQYEKN